MASTSRRNDAKVFRALRYRHMGQLQWSSEITWEWELLKPVIASEITQAGYLAENWQPFKGQGSANAVQPVIANPRSLFQVRCHFVIGCYWTLPVCLSRVWVNWLIGGGIFSLVWRTAFCLWRRMYLRKKITSIRRLPSQVLFHWNKFVANSVREFNKMFWNHVDIICPYLCFIMLNFLCHNKWKNAKNTYLGHLTKCVRSLFGWISCPMPKDLGLFSKSGLDTRLTSGFFTAKGAAATFFPFLFCWKRRRIDKLVAARWIMDTLHLQ